MIGFNKICAVALLITALPAHAQQPNLEGSRMSPDQVRQVAPALERYTQERLYGEVWNRPGLSKRDRSLVTIAAMIAKGQASAINYYADQALENGVKPAEISETITHLAYYAGWGSAMGALNPVSEVFTKRGIGVEQLPAANPVLMPLDASAEAKRVEAVKGLFAGSNPGLEGYTTDYLFNDLWLRPGLAPRDRSLVTVSALIANGQSGQIGYHLGRAMDAGLTQEQAAEVITHLAFYTGWPNAMSAMPVAKEMFAKQALQKEPVKQ